MAMDFEKLMQQAQQMQEQMAKAQEELAGETVEASAGGGMVTVKATGALEITEIKISPEAIDPQDPELLADTVLAAVNEALRSAQQLVEAHEVQRELGPGEVVGEISLVEEDGLRRARVVAKTPVRCLALGRTEFEQMLEGEPELAESMRELARGRLSELEDSA